MTVRDCLAREWTMARDRRYTYFTGKDELFTSFVAAVQERRLEETFRGLNKASGLRENLEILARKYLAWVREPGNLALTSVVVGISAKFPGPGQVSFEAGMQPPVRRLAQSLKDKCLTTSSKCMGCRTRGGAVLCIPSDERRDPDASRPSTVHSHCRGVLRLRSSGGHAAAESQVCHHKGKATGGVTRVSITPLAPTVVDQPG